MFSYRTKREAEQLKAARVARDKAYQTELRALRKMVRESAKVQAEQLERVQAYHDWKAQNANKKFRTPESEAEEQRLKAEVKANEPYSREAAKQQSKLAANIIDLQQARRKAAERDLTEEQKNQPEQKQRRRIFRRQTAAQVTKAPAKLIRRLTGVGNETGGLALNFALLLFVLFLFMALSAVTVGQMAGKSRLQLMGMAMAGQVTVGNAA